MTSPHNPLDYNDEHLFVSEEEWLNLVLPPENNVY
jgi:hypothetical protein